MRNFPVAVFLVLTGCASQGALPTTTTTTAASVASAEPAATEPSVPAGDLACRTSTGARTYEYFLQWEPSGKASGTLRITTPGDGVVETQSIRAERYAGMVVIDRLMSADLATHLAILRDKNGKKSLQQGDDDTHAWSACQ